MHRPVRPSRPAHGRPPARSPARALPLARWPSPVGGATRDPAAVTGTQAAGLVAGFNERPSESGRGPGDAGSAAARAASVGPLLVLVAGLYCVLPLRRGGAKYRRGGRAPRRNRFCCCAQLGNRAAASSSTRADNRLIFVQGFGEESLGQCHGTWLSFGLKLCGPSIGRGSTVSDAVVRKASLSKSEFRELSACQ